MGKRLFDIISSLIVLALLSPVLLIVAALIIVESRGGIFYKQQRVGLNNKDFILIKFRSMKREADKDGKLTIGNKDPRVTRMGYFIRRFKIDEFPQLLNVIAGKMSIVGPRPEVRKYVDLYNQDQMVVLSVRPGLTDYASLEYIDEDKLLGKSSNPEKTYVEEIMPAKLNLNLKYIDEAGLLTDLRLIFKTIGKIFRNR